MKTPTISLCLVGKNELNYFLKEVIDSALKFVDEIVYVDTGSTDGTVEWIKENYPDIILGYIEFKTPQDFTTAKNYSSSLATCDYVLLTDCDEVFTENMQNVKAALKEKPDVEMWSLIGEHYMGDLVHKDKIVDVHVWLNRLHKNIDRIKFPENTMHGLPGGHKSECVFNGISIRHYGFCKNMCDVLRRYETNIYDFGQNRDVFLRWQFWKMITGTYPGQPVEPYPPIHYINILLQHPPEIKEKFHIKEIIEFIQNGKIKKPE